jgi:hypothetical protein
VDRWYQLDAYAYLLPAAFAELDIPTRPSSMLLACAGASNMADHAFVQTGAISPAKFVHTLPNIRSSSLLAVMQWNGPIFTLQRDPFTLSIAFREAAERAAGGEECWVWSVWERSKVDLFVFGSASEASTHQWAAKVLEAPGTPMAEDLAILQCFWDSVEAFDFEHWVVRKK